ncbi:hypothetical protein B9479_005976 [Cryptococcus floricola]|uniref:Uncharacterized protein n=1 Tax=Cryptococcus floricola TaxID=2591691 RepID=A0A5D3AUB2_9TREE|nr:hypothetical protein B9479_005976 [Cryptococcus floricola]
MFTHTAFSLPSTHTPLPPTTPPRASSRSPTKARPTSPSPGRPKRGRERRKKNSGLSRFTSSPASSPPGDSGDSGSSSPTSPSPSPSPKPKYRRRVHPLQHIPQLQKEPSLETITESDESDGSSTPGLSRSSSVSRLSLSPSLSSLTSLRRLVGLSSGGKGSDGEGEGEGGEGGWWSLLPAWTRWESGDASNTNTNTNTNTEHKDTPSYMESTQERRERLSLWMTAEGSTGPYTDDHFTPTGMTSPRAPRALRARAPSTQATSAAMVAYHLAGTRGGAEAALKGMLV